MTELAQNSTARSLWVVVNGKVYDVTNFMFDHPGGEEIIMQYGGKDVSDIMRDHKEHEHSDSAFEMLQEFQIGTLSASESFNQKNKRKENSEKKLENFIDIFKPMLPQVWNSNFSKEFYLKEVHIPRHRSGSAPIFPNQYLELLSLTPWYVVPLVWLPFVGYLTYNALLIASPFTLIGWFLFGILNWTFLEYTLHRFLFHIDQFLPDNRYGLTLHFLTHGIHHYLPMDGLRLVMPPALFVILSFPFYKSYEIFLPKPIFYSMAAGTYFGYVCYDLMHYYLHHGRPLTEHIREMKSYHLDHHYKEANL
ncbi:fatty acid alpha-hydroxylase, partial [Nowakowskiella sp. JEL0078]